MSVVVLILVRLMTRVSYTYLDFRDSTRLDDKIRYYTKCHIWREMSPPFGRMNT